MDDEPPPLPPKLRSAAGSRYTEQDIAKALAEEDLAYERIKREKLGRTQSHRAASAIKDKNFKDIRTQSLNVKTSVRPSETKPRPRPHTASAKPSPKPRTLIQKNADTTDNALQKKDGNSCGNGRNAGNGNRVGSESSNDNDGNTSRNSKGHQQPDLMSFSSPEKPKNDILELLHTINANQSALVPVTRQSFQSHQSSHHHSSYHSTLSSHHTSYHSNQSHSPHPSPNTLGPTPNLSTYHGVISSAFPAASPWGPVSNQNGLCYPNFNSLPSNYPLSQTTSCVQFPNINAGHNQFISAQAGSLSAPPLPQRCPVFEPNMSSLISKLSVSQNNPISSSNLSSTTPSPSNSLVLAGTSVAEPNVSASSVENVQSPASEHELTPSPTKRSSDDLIDFNMLGMAKSSPKGLKSSQSVFDLFDPLVIKAKEEEEEFNVPKTQGASSNSAETKLSKEASELLQFKRSKKKRDDDEVSYYEQVDPFEYMHPGASSTRSDPVYDIYDGLVSPGAVGGDTFDIPPPLPPRALAKDDVDVELRKTKLSPIAKRSNIDKKRSAVLFDGKSSSGQIHLRKIPTLSADDEARAFWDCIRTRRGEYTWDDHIGNPGLLHSCCIEGTEDPNLSVKLRVQYSDKDPVIFTCNLTSSVEHVVMHTVCTLELEGESADYVLKVRGIDDYLSGETALGEYEYVHTCIKYDTDVSFTLLHADYVKKSYQRTAEDDETVLNVPVEDLMSAGSVEVVHHDKLIIVVETFETELTRLQNSGFLLIDGTPVQDLPSPMRSRRLRQVVKQMCALLGKLETFEIQEGINALVNTCRTIQQSQGILDGEEDLMGHRVLSTGSHDFTTTESLKNALLDCLSRLSGAVNNFLGMYAKAFRVDFTVDDTVDAQKESQEIQNVREKVTVKIQGLHRLNYDWKYDEFFVEAQIFHGSRCIGKPVHSINKRVAVDPKFYPNVVFNQTLDLGARFNTLPKESRLVLTVYGLKIIEAENKVEQPKYIREELGWASIQYFSFKGNLSQGKSLLTLWPMVSDRRLGPAPYSSDHPQVHHCPVISLELVDFGGEVLFPEIVPLPPKKLEFSSLDINTQQLLQDIIERDIFTFNKGSLDEREILWEKRHYLHEESFALAKVLLAAHSWDVSCLPDLHSLVKNWCPPVTPADALHLLLPCFADSVVRAKAIEWIRSLGSDELISFLPQLVQAVKHEAWDISPTAELLLERALTSPRLAHHLYWLLNQCLPLQTNMGGEREVLSDARYRRRLNLVTRALMAICGKNMERRLLAQEAILRSLYATAMNIKDTKDTQRMNILSRDLENIHQSLEAVPTSLPLSPSLEVSGVDIKNCSYFNSFTVPLRLAFTSSEIGTDSIHAIFKVGDDLRQDMLVIQMIRLMDKLWLKEDLDLKVVTFSIVPTGDKIGIIELVKDAETLRKIQTEYGVTGSFQDCPIAEWLAKQNPSQLEYQRAVKNFTASCAAYCVATYILGICDRHNDNIMLKTSGHLFHIDFGKFLGDAQKFGNFKRDRTPFVLTSDMAYVINGGEKPSDNFQGFVDLCCRAFNIIRRNGQLLLYLFALMASSGIPGVTWDAVTYVEKALLQDRTNAEAGAMFARMIQESLKSWFTQVNFFIHNLAQLRFSGDHSEDSLLSFIPRVYTQAQDGKILLVRLYSYQKRYNPNKYYVYILQVEREGQREPTYLFRSYCEFSEFHQKLCLIFPLARIHSIPKGVQIGRSEVKAVAERRKLEIELFLATLFDLAPEISHSDLVYTFFHPLLRDQEDTDIHIRKLKNKDTRPSNIPPVISTSSVVAPPGQVQGQVKVCIQYLRGQLQIMVQHARNLSLINNNQEPSPYIKLYLLPDQFKKTKRKTKVVKKSCHPTFMEPITYRMSLDIIKERVLEISVWSEDIFSENMYLGSSYLRLAALDLKEEQSEWLSLEHQRNTALGHTIQHSA